MRNCIGEMILKIVRHSLWFEIEKKYLDFEHLNIFFGRNYPADKLNFHSKMRPILNHCEKTLAFPLLAILVPHFFNEQ